MPGVRDAKVEPLPAERFRRLLRDARTGFGIDLADSDASRLATFLSELDRWRRTVNLTGRLSASDLVTHTLESLVGDPLIPARSRVVDIGTGGGFPGVPLAIRRPDLRFTWLEPRDKRAAFLSHVARVVPVGNAEVENGRLEDLAPESFSFATVRAVSFQDAALARISFLAPGGGLLAWTTRADELALRLAPAGMLIEKTVPIPGSRSRAIALFRRE